MVPRTPASLTRSFPTRTDMDMARLPPHPSNTCAIAEPPCASTHAHSCHFHAQWYPPRRLRCAARVERRRTHHYPLHLIAPAPFSGACHPPSQLLPTPHRPPPFVAPSTTARTAPRARGSPPSHAFLSQKVRAFWKSLSHGPAAMPSQPGGAHGNCHGRKQRSGCGIIARWRPSSEQSAAMPCTEPLGLWGYASVIWLVSST